MPQYTLTYYDARGWAESIRQILSQAGADWKDVRVPVIAPGATPLPDDVKARAPYGQVPILEFDGKLLAQSVTIARYLAKQFNLTGKDDFEAAKCDEFVDATKDIAQLFLPHWREQDAEKKAAGIKEAGKQARERFLNKFNDNAKANGGYLVGSGLTWADIIVANTLEMLTKMAGLDIDDLPSLQKVKENVDNSPGIKAWLAKRPQTAF